MRIHRSSVYTSSTHSCQIRAFITVCFPPVTVGSQAGDAFDFTYKGDIFPQFVQKDKSNITCEICILYQKWAIENHLPHTVLKSRQASAEAIRLGTAKLEFAGVVQTKEHSRSKYHQEALSFFATSKPETPKLEKTPAKRKTVMRSQKSIENFFNPVHLN